MQVRNCQFFSGPSFYLVTIFSVYKSYYKVFVIFSQMMTVFDIFAGYTDIQNTKYVNNFAFKLFIFYSFRDALDFCVVSSTILINAANITFRII